jgi:hypothetical protein
MARTNVTTQKVVKTGLAPVLTAPTADGDVIDCGRVILRVDNNGAAAVTVTVQTPVQVRGLAVAELIVSVPAGGTRYIGPLEPSLFGQPSGSPDAGRAYVDYSSVTDVARGVLGL